MAQFFRVLAASLLLATWPPASGFCQQAVTGATIGGRVVDPAGARVANAAVTVRGEERNEIHRAVTSADGRFELLYLPVGPYEVTVRAAGFSPSTVRLRLAIGQAVDLPVTLALEGMQARVDVVADARALDTRRTQAAETIVPEEIDALPLNGRNYLDLALLVPGVSRTVQRNTERFAETSAVPGTGLSVSGQRNLNNTFIVDGLSANDDAAGLSGTYFAEDVIREFQVVTSGGVAEFGRASSGVVNIVTRSGGNEPHGRAYGFFRDDALDARNPLATRQDPLRQAQYGGSLSGPLAANRTFAFGNVELTDLARTGIVTVPSPTVDRVNAVLDRTGYRGPRLTTGEFPTGYETTNVFARVDHTLTERTRLAARYSVYDVSSENARSVGGLSTVSRGTRLDNRDHTVALTALTSLGPRAFNEARAQYTRSRLSAPANDQIGPAVTISGVANVGTSTTSPTARDLDVYELSNSSSVQRGRHLLKVGGQVLYERLDITFPGALQGGYTFQSLALFEQGRYINVQQAFGLAGQFQTNPNIGLFVQDEWRPANGLTVNAGLRYDLQWLEEPVQVDADNVSPRVGLAYAPGDGRTVIRASGGLYFDRIPLRAVSNALQRDGVKYRTALVTFGEAGAPAFPAVLPAFPSSLLTNVTSIDPGIESGVARQANLQVERQVARTLSASAGYTYLAGRGIVMSRNVNVPTLTAAQAAALGVANLGRPDPTVANNSRFESLGQSDYHGLAVAVAASPRAVGTLRLSYTLSKALDDAGNAFFSTPQNNADVRDDYARSDNDQRRRLVVSGTTRPVCGVHGAFLFSYTSAPPFNLVTGNDRNNDTTVNDRPAGVGRNTGAGFDTATLDVRLMREFRVRAAHRVDVMLDVFNALNRTNFLIPNNTYGTGATPLPAFGQPTAAGDPRQVQLGVRWSF